MESDYSIAQEENLEEQVNESFLELPIATWLKEWLLLHDADQQDRESIPPVRSPR